MPAMSGLQDHIGILVDPAASTADKEEALSELQVLVEPIDNANGEHTGWVVIAPTVKQAFQPCNVDYWAVAHGGKCHALSCDNATCECCTHRHCHQQQSSACMYHCINSHASDLNASMLIFLSEMSVDITQQ